MRKLRWLFLLLIAAVGGIALYRHACLRIPQEVFDANAWQTCDTLHYYPSSPTSRQRMIKDLINNVLTGKTKSEIESVLGRSPMHAEMRRYTDADLQIREKDEHGNRKPFPRSGKGHYFDEYSWDLIYPIGKERIFIYDHKGIDNSPDAEELIIRLDGEDKFQSWFIYGANRWPDIVGEPGRSMYRRTR